MVELSRHRVITIEKALAPVWVRLRPTQRDQAERVGKSLYRVGPDESLRRALATSIDEADQVVLVASFLLSDELVAEAMLRAARRNVRVYVLTASEARLTTVVREEDGFEARMVKEHKQLLDRLAGHVVLRSAEHFHAKFLVTDPATNPAGWLSTANFNRALQDSVELGVKLPPRDAQDLAAWFSRAFWLEAERELTEKGRLANVHSPPAQPRHPSSERIVVTARDEQSLRAAVLKLLRSARRRLVVASYGLDADHEAVQVLEERVQAGVTVTVLTRPRPAVAAAVKRLAAAGATVIAHDKLHAKAIVSDDEALLMTANLQADGLDRGFEVGYRLEREASQALVRTLKAWVDNFPWKFEPALARSEHLGEVCLADAGLRTGRREVVEETVVSLQPVIAASALDLAAAPEPRFPLPRERDKFFQQVRFEWIVKSPRLPKKAAEVFRAVTRVVTGKNGKKKTQAVSESYDPRVYTHSGKKYVVLTNPDQAPAARELASEFDATVVVP